MYLCVCICACTGGGEGAPRKRCSTAPHVRCLRRGLLPLELQGREHMPSFCLEYIIDSLPAKYQVANESALEGPVL